MGIRAIKKKKKKSFRFVKIIGEKMKFLINFYKKNKNLKKKKIKKKK